MAEIRGTTWDDFDAVIELAEGQNTLTLGSDTDAGYLRRRWQSLGAGLGRNSWLAVEDGRTVGYALLDATGELGLTASDGAVETTLIDRAEARARERGLEQVELTSSEQDGAMGTTLERRGFARGREIFRMWRTLDADLPAPQWPDGVTVRTYRDDDAQAVHALLDQAYASWDTAYVVRAHDDWLAFMTAHDEFDADLWFVVEKSGALVACALHWHESDGDGWVKDLAVRAGERGRGLGTALLARAFAVYAERGAARVGLKVDAANPTGAVALYERLGFVTDQRLTVWVKRL